MHWHSTDSQDRAFEVLLNASEMPVEDFKTVDVQQSNPADVLLQPLVANAFIDAPHKPVEQARVDHFGHGVSSERC